MNRHILYELHVESLAWGVVQWICWGIFRLYKFVTIMQIGNKGISVGLISQTIQIQALVIQKCALISKLLEKRINNPHRTYLLSMFHVFRVNNTTFSL